MFENIENFRDLGGAMGREGQIVRSDVVYRSSDHSHATDQDLDRLKQLNIGTIVDLRRPLERERAQSRRPEGVTYDVITSDIPEERLDWAVALKDVDHVDLAWFDREAREFYINGAKIERYVDLFSRFFQLLAHSDAPILTHCSAGKDRTGMLCALVLHTVGVHRDDIVAEFVKTNDPKRIARAKPRLRAWLQKTSGHVVDDEALEFALSVHPEHMDLMFCQLEEEFGSTDEYLSKVLGVDSGLKSRIETRLLS
ncbi:protein-tyrosine-phosphatase [Tateyamaria omphalii]|uniref:tyrosine-protein phosphatase n=1 Tax=Tateyamaria omphalii TaxID=299262 RepID=UPI00167648F1|nr:tyrosine-protein phosphatase [Tateyamaria omphalii]GGX69214.1 protein-tyrosine-phosphatase [Tateyamaria omphalii]